MANDCRICGWEGMAFYHKGAVDCINAYRAYVDELRSLLPQGREVMRAPIDRAVTVRLWIEGEPSREGLDRLITYIRFMQEAWTPEPKASANAEAPEPDDPDASRPPTEANGVIN